MLPVAALFPHLRLRAPALARRLDGITGLERAGDVLRVRVSAGGWAHRELPSCLPELRSRARELFGPSTRVELAVGPSDPERLPFPVLSSKHWNLVAFWAWDGTHWACAAVPKPEYRKALEGGVSPEPGFLGQGPLPPGGPAAVLPDLLEDLARKAQADRSYAHLVIPFPGDTLARDLETALYTAKDWGTPRVPGPVLQRYVGRIHCTDPARPPLGVRMAQGMIRPASQ